MNARTVELYARVSTKYQHTARQAEMLARYSTDHQDEAVNLTEEVASGKDFKAPLLRGIWERIKKKQVKKVVVYRLDRLGRSLQESVRFVKDCLANDCQLVALDGGVDVSSPQGRMIFNVLMSFAEFEREMISLRTAEGLDRAKDTCKNCGKYQPDTSKPRCECWSPQFVGGTRGRWMSSKVAKKRSRVLELFDKGVTLRDIQRITKTDFRTIKRLIDTRHDPVKLRECVWDR